MEKWRNKFSLAVMTAGLLAFAPAVTNADSCDPCCDPCDWSLCDLGGFELGIDFLWVKPCIDDLDYAAKIHSDGHTHVHYEGICPEWEPGVRVTLGMDDFFCNWDLRASYTYINSDDSSSVSGDDEIVALLGHQGLSLQLYDHAKGSWSADYHEWDILFGYELCPTQCHHFMPFFGVAGIVVDQELTAKYEQGESIEHKVKWDSDYWGVGLRAGTNYEYRMNDCLRVYANANATLLAGEVSAKHKHEFGSEVHIKDDGCCHCVPGYHLGTGIIYDASYCDCDFSVKLGYEFTQWHNFPRHRIFAGDDLVGHATSSSTREFGYHGLTLGVAMGF